MEEGVCVPLAPLEAPHLLLASLRALETASQTVLADVHLRNARQQGACCSAGARARAGLTHSLLVQSGWRAATRASPPPARAPRRC